MPNEEKKRNLGAIPYFALFIPILASPFFDKSTYSISFLIAWALALFVYPLFLVVEREKKPHMPIVLASRSKARNPAGEKANYRNMLHGVILCLSVLVFSALIFSQSNDPQGAFYYTIFLFLALGAAIAYLAKKNWIELGWLFILPFLLALIRVGVDFQILYTVLALLALLLATMDSYPEFVGSKKPA